MWVTAAVSFAAMLVMSRANRDPGDDADPAWQRPGLLDLGALPVPAPPLNGVDPSGPLVVFFQPGSPRSLCHQLTTSGLRDEATIVVVTDGTPEVSCPAAAVAVVDDADLAARFRLREPAHRGYPTGYAVIDSDGQIRYTTLDPTVAEELDEVRTIVRALP